ncbi:NADH:flavin oxidoreductase/NADH oxidase [Alloscardovia omnicolens]|uniref:oxidoreductase n=1 Tax=Alloscardovia omnicolens TaxID=419015 RepID=UPI0028ED8381|nr:NADH:flavin oxidoreductase/NADH oxidase [Alloscardovia omnicolens]
MSQLLSGVTLGNLTLKNRVVMPPMCMYVVEREDGIATNFHFAHYGARAIGGVGLIIVEATAVEPDGRITNKDLGLWNEEQKEVLHKLTTSVHELGSQVAIQLNHAGRKTVDARIAYAPSPLAFNEDSAVPHEMSSEDIERVKQAFVDAAIRARDAKFDAIEIHAAHGYLLSEFLEPLTNQRSDNYGGSLENRYRLLHEIVCAIRAIFDGSLWVRLSLSAYDDTERQNSREDWQQIGRWLEADGVDCIDVSTGAVTPARPNIPMRPGYQVPFTILMKQAVNIPVTAVGLIDSAQLAEHIVSSGQADLAEIGRGLLRNPQWVADAARVLHEKDFAVYNASYERAYH